MKSALYTSAIVFLCALAPARADMTEWVEVHGGAVRLISSGPLQDGHYLAGLEFLLEPGWHTYWRYPGEAGIPPQISVTKSENLNALEILYPVPERYDDGFSESIVYHDGVVLPIRVLPASADRETGLEVEVLFGICKDICVPGEAVLSLDFAPGDKDDKLAAKLIERDLAAVPAPGGKDGFGVASVTRGEDGTLVIETRNPGKGDADLFAAGPEGSFIGLPKFVTETGEQAVWHLSTKGLVTSQNDDQLRLVLSSGGKAVEHLEPIPPEWID